MAKVFLAFEDEQAKQSKRVSRSFSISYLVLAFCFALAFLYVLFINFPNLPKEHSSKLKIPTTIDDVKFINKILESYKDHYYMSVFFGFSCVYIFLQTFSIPGSIFLSFLAGALFGFPIGVLVVCSLSTIGASNCYFLSYYIGRNLVQTFFSDRLKWFEKKMRVSKANILNFILFLRLTPIIPNWSINIVSPILGVPWRSFAIGTFFGVMPQTMIAVHAGLTLHQISSTSDVLDFKLFLILFALSLISLLPTWPPVQTFLNDILVGGYAVNHTE